MNRGLLHDILRKLFAHDDVRDTFATGMSLLMQHQELLATFDHDGLSVLQSAYYQRACELSTTRLSHFVSIARSRQKPLTLPLAARQALRRDLSRLTIGVSNADVPQTIFPITLGFLTAIDVTCDGLIRTAQGVNTAPHVFEVASDRAFTRPLPAFGYSRKPRELPPPSSIQTSYVLLDRYFSNLTVPPVSPTTNALRPGLYTPPGVRGVHDAPEEIRIGIASILADAKEVAWQFSLGEFWAPSVHPDRKEAVLQRLRWAVKAAIARGVHVLVIPELNLDAELEEDLITLWAAARQLQNAPLFLVAGLLHRPTQRDPSRFRNQPLVLTQDGLLPWPYWKFEPTQWEFKEEGTTRIEALARDAQHVVALDTAVGRLCVVICRDALMNETISSIIAMRSTLVIIPSMTSVSSISKFKSAARDFADGSHAVTIFCNSSIHLRAGNHSGGLLGFVHPNTRHNIDQIPSHALPSPDAAAVLGVYELRFGSGAAKPGPPQVIWTIDGVVTNDASD